MVIKFGILSFSGWGLSCITFDPWSGLHMITPTNPIIRPTGSLVPVLVGIIFYFRRWTGWDCCSILTNMPIVGGCSRYLLVIIYYHQGIPIVTYWWWFPPNVVSQQWSTRKSTLETRPPGLPGQARPREQPGSRVGMLPNNIWDFHGLDPCGCFKRVCRTIHWILTCTYHSAGQPFKLKKNWRVPSGNANISSWRLQRQRLADPAGNSLPVTAWG